MHELVSIHDGSPWLEAQPEDAQSSLFDISEDQRQTYQAELTRQYVDRNINSVDVRVINSLEDLAALVLILHGAGRMAKTGRVMVFMISPSPELLKATYEMLGDDVKNSTPIPQGIEELAEGETRHVEAVKLIKEGRGIANSLGIPSDFLFCFRILVYPDFRVNNPEDVLLRLNISTLVNHEATTTFDQRLAMNLEIILGSLNRQEAIPQEDRIQLLQILRWANKKTPLLNRVIQELISLIPPEFKDELKTLSSG